MEPMGRADPQAQVNTPWPNSSDPFLERSGFRVWGGGGVLLGGTEDLVRGLVFGTIRIMAL